VGEAPAWLSSDGIPDVHAWTGTSALAYLNRKASPIEPHNEKRRDLSAQIKKIQILILNH
jgi:hypothetical protein